MLVVNFSFVSLILLQCRHLIPILNAWATCAQYTTACPIVTQFLVNVCMDDFTIESSFDSLAEWFIEVVGLFFDNFSMGVSTGNSA